MEAQTIKVGDFSQILGASVDGDEFTHIASIHKQLTACGKTPSSYNMGHDFYLNCPNCLAEIQWRHDHPDCSDESFGVVTRDKE